MITWIVGPASGRWEPSPRSLWHPVDDIVSWTSSSKNLRVTCFTFASDRLPGQLEVVRTEGRIALVTGWPLVGSQALATAAPSELARSLEEASGSFTWLCLEDGPAGPSGRIGSDAFCTGLIYTAQTPEGPLWSNDAGVLGDLLESTPDMDATVWNAYSAFWLDDTTSLTGISAIPPGKSVRVVGGQSSLDGPSSTWLRGNPGDRETQLDALVEAIRSTLVRTAEAEADVRTLGLTGGKDSRMLLAALISADVVEAFTFETMGHDADPDVVAAKALADKFGLRWKRTDEIQTSMDSDEFGKRLGEHLFATRGMLNAWTLKGLGSPHRRLELTGLFGEVLRSHFGALPPDMPTVDGIRHRIAADAGGLLTSDARERADQQVRDLVTKMLADGIAEADLIDALFLDRRLRRWSGTAQTINQVNLTGMPLMQRAALDLARSTSARDRDAGRVSLELIERLAPQVLEVPMAMKSWSPAALEGSRDPGNAGQAPITGTTRTGGPWQERLWATTGPVFAHHLKDSATLGTLYDGQRSADAIENYRRIPRGARVSLWGALTSAMWTDGAWKPVVLNTAGQRRPVASAPDAPVVFPVPSRRGDPPSRSWPSVDQDLPASVPVEMVPRSELDGATSRLRAAEDVAKRRDEEIAALRARKVVRLGLKAADSLGRLARSLRGR